MHFWKYVNIFLRCVCIFLILNLSYFPHMWILLLYFPTSLYARLLCLASFYLLIKSRICLQSEQGCILLGEFFEMENLKSLNWNGFGYDHSLFKTDQYFLWFLGAQCILLKQNPSLSLNHVIWFRNKTSMYLLSVMVCPAPGCNDDRNKVRGIFLFLLQDEVFQCYCHIPLLSHYMWLGKTCVLKVQ